MKLLQCDIEVIEVSRLTDLLEQDQSYNYFRQQQDCLELFNLLIRHIESAQQEILQLDLSSIRRKELNLINPFLHYTKMRIICRTCNKAFQSTKLESHYNIHLQIEKVNSIHEAMELLVEPEKIDDYICLYCTLDRMQQLFGEDKQIIEEYKHKSYFDNDAQEIIKKCLEEINKNIDPKKVYQRRQVYKYIAIAKYPSIICFHLNRVVFYHDQLYKIDKQICLDSQVKFADKTYGLSSVICHLGNSNFGHYVTIKRTFAPELLNHLEEKQKYNHQEWYLTSDKYVALCEEPNKSEAYLVFYDSL